MAQPCYSKPDNYLLKAPVKGVDINIYDTNWHLFDVFNLNYNEQATVSEDRKYDAAKRTGSDFSFYSLSAEGQKLAIDARPASNNMVVPLGITTGIAQDYMFRVEHIDAVDGQQLVLIDKFLNKQIKLTDGTTYRFTISHNKETQGNSRFELRSMPANAAADAIEMSVFPNPATNIVKVNYAALSEGNMKIVVSDVTGNSILNREMPGSAGSTTVDMSNYAPGVYMLELICGSARSITKLVKE